MATLLLLLRQLCEFEDDRQRMRLRTLFATFPPAEVIRNPHGLSATTRRILRFDASEAQDCFITSEYRFPCEVGVGVAAINGCCAAEEESLEGGELLNRLNALFKGGREAWPAALRSVAEEYEQAKNGNKAAWSLGLQALGGCYSYLHRCLLEESLFSMKHFSIYTTAQTSVSVPAAPPKPATSPMEELRQLQQLPRMVLDGATLVNLEILENSVDYSRQVECFCFINKVACVSSPLWYYRKGTLLGLMDTTTTPFGRRLFRSWVCNPLLRVEDINDR